MSEEEKSESLGDFGVVDCESGHGSWFCAAAEKRRRSKSCVTKEGCRTKVAWRGGASEWTWSVMADFRAVVSVVQDRSCSSACVSAEGDMVL